MKSAPKKESNTLARHHVYRDFATVEEKDMSLPEEQAGKQRGFPEVLHFVIDEMEKDGLSDICSWQPHGRSFMVHDQKRFEAEILPNWFRQTKLASFQRQLNFYCFVRVPSGPDKGSYYHEMFLRGKLFLAKHIKRIQLKGNGCRKALRPEDVPNFYSLPAVRTTVQPLPATSPTLQSAIMSAVQQTNMVVPNRVRSGGMPGIHDSLVTRNAVLPALAAAQSHRNAILSSLLNPVRQQQLNSELVLAERNRLLGQPPLPHMFSSGYATTPGFHQHLASSLPTAVTQQAEASWTTPQAILSLRPPWSNSRPQSEERRSFLGLPGHWQN